DLDLGAAELAVVAALDLAAELLRHRLLAVADAEHRHAGLVDRLWRERRVLCVHRGRSTGEDHCLRLHLLEGLLRLLVRHDLGIDLLLPHPPRDELGDLGAEIDDQDFVVGLFGHSRPAVRCDPTAPSRTTWNRPKRPLGGTRICGAKTARSSALRWPVGTRAKGWF